MAALLLHSSGVAHVRTQLRSAVAPVLENHAIAHLESSLLPFSLAEFGTWVAILVFGYHTGGVAAAGIIGFLLLAPAALSAPFSPTVCTRLFGRHALVAGYLAQAAAYGATGTAMLVHAPLFLVVVLAISACVALTSTRPLVAAALPAAAETPQQLTSAALLAGWIEGFGFVAGPAVAGVILLLAPSAAVYIVMAVFLVGSALLASSAEHEETGGQGSIESAATSLGAGIRAVVSDGNSGAVASFMLVHYLILGGIDVILVTLAFRLLHLGQAGLGLLTTAFGCGCVVGASAGLLLLSGRRLTQGLVVGAAAWGIGLSFLALIPGRYVVVLLVVLAGAGRPLITVSGRLLLQRVASEEMLVPLFALLEGLSLAGIAVGLACMPLVLALLGNRTAFVLVGLLLPILLLAFFRQFSALEDRGVLPEERLALLRSVPMFQPLSLMTIDRLARSMTPVEAGTGEAIVRQDEPGRTFYMVAAGRLLVDVDGRPVRTLGDRDYFGEIALLRDGVRTATVTAQGPAYLYALDRTPFLAAVTGHAESSEAASAVINTRLANDGTQGCAGAI